jgi:hypothetical protein
MSFSATQPWASTNTDLNYTPVDFAPSTLKSIMLFRQEFGAQFGSHLDDYWQQLVVTLEQVAPKPIKVSCCRGSCDQMRRREEFASNRDATLWVAT